MFWTNAIAFSGFILVNTYAIFYGIFCSAILALGNAWGVSNSAKFISAI